MDREKENPYVTKIKLNDEIRRLEVKIDGVDRKHEKNYDNVTRLLEVAEATNKSIVQSNIRLGNAFDNFSQELKDELKENRRSHQTLTEKVRTHESQLKSHNEFIAEQKEIKDSKKGSLIKWVVALTGIFVAIITGIFTIIEVLIPYIMDILIPELTNGE